MCAYARNQYHRNFIADFGFDPVCIAFYVENHPIVAQKARARIPRFNVRWAGPIRLLNLENPRLEWTANISVLL